jgi:hypothetical protein
MSISSYNPDFFMGNQPNLVDNPEECQVLHLKVQNIA